ncbi:nucleotidyltransferase domain-containing protein [Candidatus Sumerlaeota bacterium]|nr:nucleotidyltransferase domain-containing protein [Candidatus Sumerlaeota bacterium]
MVVTPDSVIEVIKRYVKELEKNGIPVEQVILFGSYAKGTIREDSDVDIALVSPAFSGDRFEDRRRLVPLRRNIDSRIEPIPLTPEDFSRGGSFIDEIKRTGIVVKKV